MEEQALQIALETLGSKLLWAGLVLLVANMLKDALVKFGAGVWFFLDPDFRVGDAVFLDGDPAEITAIGVFTTKFRILPAAASGKPARHRILHNNKLPEVRLEKPVAECHGA